MLCIKQRVLGRHEVEDAGIVALERLAADLLRLDLDPGAVFEHKSPHGGVLDARTGRDRGVTGARDHLPRGPIRH